MNILIVEFIVAVVLVLTGFGAGWSVQGWRYGEKIATMEKDAAEAQTKAVGEVRAKEQAQTKVVQEALNNALQREAKLALAADAANRSSGSLRDELATTRDRVSRATLETCRATTSLLTDILGECSEEYRRMAAEADKYGNSARTLDEAWPR